MTIGGRKLPTIDNANALWLKQTFDPSHYDEDFIRRIWKRNPPPPTQPHDLWIQQLRRNIGMNLPTSEA